MNETEVKSEKKFSLKEFDGDRIKVLVPNCTNIRRIYSWNKILKRYGDPPRGGRYEARRVRNNKVDRETRIFNELQDARDWQLGHNFNPIEESASTPRAASGYLIEDLLNDWQRLAWPTLRETSRVFYSQRVKSFEFLFGIRVEDLTPKIIDEWLLVLKSPKCMDGYKSNRYSVDKELSIFKTMINWYLENNDDTKLINPFKKRHSKLAQIKERPAVGHKYMTGEESERWLAVLKTQSPFFWSLAVTQLNQLLRVSEVAAMKWSNLNLKERSYRVAEHIMWVRSNGRPPIIAPGTKTNHSGETFNIYLRLDVLKVLAEIQPNRTHDLIFHNEGNLLTYKDIQNAYNRAFKAAGLPHRSTHVLRRTGATEFLEETGDTLALQQMGNWADQKMALHYGKILSTRAKNAIDRSERNLSLYIVKNEENDEAI